MVFLGGEYLGAYARIAQNNSWNTTIHSGGRYANFDAHQAWIDLAYRAQAPFNMDFTTVDVAESEDGPIVFEVSAFGGFRGAKEGIGMDAAAKPCSAMPHCVRRPYTLPWGILKFMCAAIAKNFWMFCRTISDTSFVQHHRVWQASMSRPLNVLI